ncbi:MAG: 3-deoxy-7-phosphoheptulonate synthase, partial [Vulcanococcus sp.]
AGSRHVMGVMIESHLVAGNQKIPADLSQLTYGQSITDACIDLGATRDVLAQLADAVAAAQAQSTAPVAV